MKDESRNDPRDPEMLTSYSQLAARLQVFIEAFILALRSAGSSCLIIQGLGDAL
jgi:hypothetical protein